MLELITMTTTQPTTTDTTNTTHEIRPKRKRRRTPFELLNDLTVVSVTVSQAAQILGMSKSTAHKNYRATGFLLNGSLIPVYSCGSRTIVSLEHLRQVLNYPTPIADSHLDAIERVLNGSKSD